MSKLFLTILVVILVLPAAWLPIASSRAVEPAQVMMGKIPDLPAGWEPDRRLRRTQAASQTSINFARSIAADESGRVHLAWRDEQDGNPEIYYKSSIDAGASWSANTRLTTTSGQSQRPVIAHRGSQLFIVYWDNEGLEDEVYILQSKDLGASWSPPERLTFGNVASLVPSVAAAASGVHVAWTDGRDQNAEVYYKRLPGKAVRVANGRN